MKKWFGCICLLALCLLTGCGHEDKLLQYMDTEIPEMINTSEQAEDYNKQLDRDDHLKWVYDTKEIDGLVQLIQFVKAEAKKAGCHVSEEALFGEGGVELWMAHARQGFDPTKETLSQPGMYIEGKTKESVQRVCTAIEKAGYPGVAACIENEIVVSRGMRFVYDYDEEQEENEGYSLNISISNYLGYYPENYKDIRDVLIEGGYFVNTIQCFGGVVNRIVAEKEEEEALFREIAIQTDQDGQIVEVDAYMDDSTQTKIQQESERKTLIELLTMFTGENKDVTAFIHDITKKSGRGVVTKDYTWQIQRMWEEGYMLRVQ